MLANTWALKRRPSCDEQALYVLLAATGLRASEALAPETRHFTNDGRTFEVRQQIDRQKPQIVNYLKTDAAYRDIDLHPDIVEYLLIPSVRGSGASISGKGASGRGI